MHDRRRARRPRLAHALRLLATLACCWTVSVSHAAEPPRVVLVSTGQLPATGERVRAELAAMGFVLLLDEGGAALTVDALAELAQARDAVAAVALTFSGAGVELWVVERANRQTRLRSFVSAQQTAAEPTLVLRAAELLRASLLHVAAAPDSAAEATSAALPEPARQATPAAPLAAAVALGPEPTSRTLSLRLGAGLLTSAGGLGTSPSADLAGKWWLTERLGVELGALVPLARLSEQSSEGSSSTRVGVLSLTLVAAVPLGNSAWRWDIGAGVAGVGLQTRGTPATTDYTRKQNAGVALAPLLRSALSHGLAPRVRLGLAVSAGVSLPRFLIIYAGRTAATWGRPFAAAELALEVDVL